jgi:deoxycytidylate deaminase
MDGDRTRLQDRDLRILRTLEIMAHDVAPVKTARLAAALAIRGQVLSLGNNQLKSHPFHLRFGKNRDSLYWHAETHCIHNFIRKHDPNLLQKTTLYVVRLKRPYEGSRDFVKGMARPCKGCMRCIQDFGVPRIVYSNNDNAFSCEVAS